MAIQFSLSRDKEWLRELNCFSRIHKVHKEQAMGIVRVLGALEALQHILTVFNGENFRAPTKRIVARNICRAVFASLLLLPIPLSFLAVLWHCFATGFDVAAQSVALSGALETTRSIMIYITMWSKNRMITSTLDHLQKIIDKSEFSTHTLCLFH